MTEHFLNTLFEPESLVVAGASARIDSIGYRLVKNILDGGYTGNLWLVNSQYDSILDQPCYKSIRVLPETPELAILVTPPSTLKRMLRNCAEQGIKTVLVMTNVTVPDRLHSQAGKLGIRLLGPGSAGLIRPARSLNATYSSNKVTSGKLALISHSATLASAVIDWADGKEVGFSALVSMGHETDIDVAELVDFLAHDVATRAIIVYLDRVKDSRRFLSAVSEAARHKSVLVMKPAQESHQLTDHPDSHASVQLSDRVMQAALDRAGVVRIKTFSNLFAAARILASGIRTRGTRLAVVANGAAPALLACDRIRAKGFELPPVSSGLSKILNTETNGLWSKVNPVIVHDYENMQTSYSNAVAALLVSDDYDGVLALYVPDNWCEPLGIAESIASLPNPDNKPLLTSWMGEHQVAESRSHLQKQQIPTFRTPEAAVDAFDFLVRHYRNQQLLLQLPDPVADPTAVDFVAARTLINDASTDPGALLNAADTAELLQLLQLSPDMANTDTALSDRTSRQLRLKVFQDATFGPCFSLGIGGEFASLFPHPPLQLPPLNSFLIDDLLNDSQLQRYIGQTEPTRSPGDAIHRILQRLSDLICEVPEVETLDLDPLLLDASGVRIGVANVTVRVTSSNLNSYQHLAVHPYPRAWIRTATLKDNTRITIRPIRPEDAEGIRQLVLAMSPEARYLRFMHAVDELSPRMLAQFSKIDYDRQMAFCALPENSDSALAGVARYNINPDGFSSEFSIAIADHWQGKGLATQLMSVLIEHAYHQKQKSLSGQVLVQNQAMRRLMRSMDFHCVPDPVDSRLLLCTRDLTRADSPGS